MAAHKLTAELVEQRLKDAQGNVAAVARSFGVSRQAVHEFISKRPTLVSARNDCREAMKDDAESSLYKAVLEGESWAVCFFLKTQGRDRGYVERTETHVEGEVVVKIIGRAARTEDL